MGPYLSLACGLDLFGPDSGGVLSLAIDPTNTQIVYAGTNKGIFKTTDGGGSWSPTGTDIIIVGGLAVDRANPATIYAGTMDGLYKTTDGGGSWKKCPTPTGAVYRSLAIDPTNTKIVYVKLGWGRVQNAADVVFRTDNGGTSWKRSSTGLKATDINALAIDPKSIQILYAGTEDAGVFKSADSGANWSVAGAGLTNTRITSLAIDPTNPDTVYAGTKDGVFKTVNGATSWTAASAGLTNTNITSLAIDPKNAQIVYVGTRGGVFKTTDGGITWAPVDSGSHGRASSPLSPSTLPTPRSCTRGQEMGCSRPPTVASRPIKADRGSRTFCGDLRSRGADPPPS